MNNFPYLNPGEVENEAGLSSPAEIAFLMKAGYGRM
jgi:hypothetical protein